MNDSLILGVEVGRSYLASALVDVLKGEIIEGSYIKIATEQGHSTNQLISNCCKVINRSLKQNDTRKLKIGLAIPNLLNVASRVPSREENNRNENLLSNNVRETLSKKLNISSDDIFMMNDVAAFLKGEVFNGASPEFQFKKVIGLMIGKRFGAAVYNNGAIENIDCWNKGSLIGVNEECFSTDWFIKRHHELTGVWIKDLKEISSFNKATVASRQLYNEFSINLSVLLNKLIKIHNPDAIVLGGTISNAFQTFFPELRREMNKLENYNKVFKAKLKDKAGILGAASSFVAQ
jgi:glucokinase